MRIAYATDLHGDLSTLETLCQFLNSMAESVDFFLIGGDLIGPGAGIYKDEKGQLKFDKEKAKNYREFLEKLYQEKEKSKDAPLEKIAENLGKSEKYKEWVEDCKISLQAQYETIDQILDKYGFGLGNGKVPHYAIPGNYDYLVLIEEELTKEHILHKKSVEYPNVKIFGYGGADVVPVHLPPELTLSIGENILNEIRKEIVISVEKEKPVIKEFSIKEIVSDIYEFLSKQQLDDDKLNIILTHMPPYGVLDLVEKENKKFNVGSIGLGAYLSDVAKRHTVLNLVGHAHKAIGTQKMKENVYVFNPGNLGRDGSEAFGFFGIIYTNKKDLERIEFYQILDPNKKTINHIGNFYAEEKPRFEEIRRTIQLMPVTFTL